MPALRNHTHCQVAQKASALSKTCQRVWLPKRTGRLRRIKHENTTMCIVHAGFSGLRAFVARKKGWCKLIGNRFVIPHDTIHSTLCGIEMSITEIFAESKSLDKTKKNS